MTLQDSRTLPTYCQGRRNLLDSTLATFKNLCLDAPLVALVWQDFLARVWDAPIQPIHRFILALITWLAYMGDRLLDGRQQGRTQSGSERHRFVWTHRHFLQRIWALLAIPGAALAIWQLPSRDLVPGLIALLGLAIYCLAARMWPRLFRGLLPRELLVGIFFSMACSLFVFTTLGGLPPLGALTALAFALLCSLDCWAISCTDRERDLQLGEWNLVTSYAWARQAYAGSVLAFSATALALSFFVPGSPALIFRAIALSCLLLFVLTRSIGMTRRLALYADLALMTPPAFLLLT